MTKRQHGLLALALACALAITCWADHVTDTAAQTPQECELPPRHRLRAAYASMEHDIAESLGGLPVRLPYSDSVATSLHQTDVEHRVALSEVREHACAEGWGLREWKYFAAFPPNLTLALPRENRVRKNDRGEAEYVSPRNACAYILARRYVFDHFGIGQDEDDRRAAEKVIRAQDCNGL